jgi:hypothetical protein
MMARSFSASASASADALLDAVLVPPERTLRSAIFRSASTRASRPCSSRTDTVGRGYAGPRVEHGTGAERAPLTLG